MKNNLLLATGDRRNGREDSVFLHCLSVNEPTQHYLVSFDGGKRSFPSGHLKDAVELFDSLTTPASRFMDKKNMGSITRKNPGKALATAPGGYVLTVASGRFRAPVKDFADASRVYRLHIAARGEEGFGGARDNDSGILSRGNVTTGWVSFNGKVWAGARGDNSRLLFDPYAATRTNPGQKSATIIGRKYAVRQKYVVAQRSGAFAIDAGHTTIYSHKATEFPTKKSAVEVADSLNKFFRTPKGDPHRYHVFMAQNISATHRKKR